MPGRHRKPSPPRLHRVGIVAAGTACAAALLAQPAVAAEEPDPIGALVDRLQPPEPPAEPPAPPEAEQPAPPPPPAVDEAAALRTRIVDEAASHDGAAYRYGASGPDAFDCSGFTSYVFGQVGVDLPRTSQQQRDAAERVAKEDARPGDLIFRHRDGGRVYHVGVYAGDGRMWHAPQSGQSVSLVVIRGDYSVGRVVA